MKRYIDSARAQHVDAKDTELRNKQNPPKSYLPDETTFLSTLDEVLGRQLLALHRATLHLLEKSKDGLNKDEIQSLTALLKVTADLKLRENELLDKLTDDQLKAQAEAEE